MEGGPDAPPLPLPPGLLVLYCRLELKLRRIRRIMLSLLQELMLAREVATGEESVVCTLPTEVAEGSKESIFSCSNNELFNRLSTEKFFHYTMVLPL